MTDPGFEILLDDAACFVVIKPAGLLTQAPLGIDSLEFRIKRFLKQRENLPGDVYLGVPHRLDRPVSGVIAFARNQRAARRISEQFEGRLVEKTYHALVGGHVAEDSGTWTDYLKKVEGEPRTEVVDKLDPDGRIAVLHFQVLRRLSAATLLEIRLETGRTHQIRVQCSQHGHPLLGDQLYGSRVLFGPDAPDERDRLIALHARSLRFKHPQTKLPLLFEAPLPALWNSWLE